jgi:hypothetical protein
MSDHPTCCCVIGRHSPPADIIDARIKEQLERYGWPPGDYIEAALSAALQSIRERAGVAEGSGGPHWAVVRALAQHLAERLFGADEVHDLIKHWIHQRWRPQFGGEVDPNVLAIQSFN